MPVMSAVTLISITLNVIFVTILLRSHMQADEIEEIVTPKVRKVKVAKDKAGVYHFDENCQWYKTLSGPELHPCTRCIECMHQREGR